MSLKFQLASGKKIEMDIAPIDLGLNLCRCVLNECKNAGLNLTVNEGDTIFDLILNNKEALLNVLSSEPVLEAVKDCCAKVLYDKQRFSMEIFEIVENRKDFVPLMMVVGMENIRPFFAAPHTILDSLEAQFLM